MEFFFNVRLKNVTYTALENAKDLINILFLSASYNTVFKTKTNQCILKPTKIH